MLSKCEQPNVVTALVMLMATDSDQGGRIAASDEIWADSHEPMGLVGLEGQTRRPTSESM